MVKKYKATFWVNKAKDCKSKKDVIDSIDICDTMIKGFELSPLLQVPKSLIARKRTLVNELNKYN